MPVYNLSTQACGQRQVRNGTHGTASWPNTEVTITAWLGCFVVPPVVPGILLNPAWGFEIGLELLLNTSQKQPYSAVAESQQLTAPHTMVGTIR